MPEVEYEIKESIAYITLNRPEKLNAMNPRMLQLLREAFEDLEYNPEARVAIVTGTGRAFSTGLDLTAMTPGEAPAGRSTSDLYVLLQNIWKPIISAINGLCLAQGCGLALGGDIRIASEDAQFGWPQVKRGLSSVSGPALLGQIVPRNIAFEILLTGEFIDARRAHELYLVNRVVPPGQLIPAAEDMAKKIIQNAPLALAAMKEVTVNGAAMDLERRIAYGQAKLDLMMTTEDAKEGLKAFREKRQPVWKGR